MCQFTSSVNAILEVDPEQAISLSEPLLISGYHNEYFVGVKSEVFVPASESHGRARYNGNRVGCRNVMKETTDKNRFKPLR